MLGNNHSAKLKQTGEIKLIFLQKIGSARSSEISTETTKGIQKVQIQGLS